MRKGELSFTGICATIIQEITIGKNVTIGAGSVIIKDILENTLVIGNTTKIISNKNKYIY